MRCYTGIRIGPFRTAPILADEIHPTHSIVSSKAFRYSSEELKGSATMGARHHTNQITGRRRAGHTASILWNRYVMQLGSLLILCKEIHVGAGT